MALTTLHPFPYICRQIIQAEGPSGPNRDYLFQLEEALLQFGKVILVPQNLFIQSF